MGFGQNLAASKHNFSAAAWNDGITTNKMCGPCHTPHNAKATKLIPLWAHDPSTNAGSFTLYASGTFDGATTATQPSGVSLACLSCHDGSVELGDHVKSAGTNTTKYAPAFGTDLGVHHPVSFKYTAGLDAELYDPTATASGLGNNIDDDLLFSDGTNNTLMECASCHDPHSTGIAVADKLVRKTNTNSQLCLTCHNK